MRERRTHKFLVAVAVVAVTLFLPRPSCAYSVQTHEHLIDLAWKLSIEPLLRKRFPAITDAQLHEAHAYAYGGCAIQDLGYYPFVNAFFSDLTHYVRSGDFVRSLLRNAQTPDELAFAIGALSHYIGDSVGHSEAVNPSVALEFPKLRERYGAAVSYEEDPHAHVRTEFAFDINQAHKHRFAPSGYLHHVGLEVPHPLLVRAFYETYGLDFARIVGRKRPTLRTYRWAVRRFLPHIAYAEALLHGNSFPPDTLTESFQRFEHELLQADAENGWSQYKQKSGVGTYVMAGLIYILPKAGSLSMLAIRGPSSGTEDSYVASVDSTIDALRQVLASIDTGSTELPNRDLDTGRRVEPGSYHLTDKTYAKLLEKITENTSKLIPANLKRDVLAYYADPNAPISTKENPEKWARVQAQLAALRAMNTRAEPPEPPRP